MQRIRCTCPLCGDEGPHDVVHTMFDGSPVCACANCYQEFEVTQD